MVALSGKLANRCILVDKVAKPHVHATDYINGTEKCFYFKTEAGRRAAWTRAENWCDAESQKHGAA